MRTEMIEDDDRAPFTCKDGRVVWIEFIDDAYEIVVTTADGVHIGKLILDEKDGDGPFEKPYLKLIWAFLDKPDRSYKRKGIGRECLRRAIERYSMPIVSENDDQTERDDGSHLTGDAPSFVEKMRAEKLLGHYQPDFDGLSNDDR